MFIAADGDFYASGADMLSPELVADLDRLNAAPVEIFRSVDAFVRSRITEDPELYQAVASLLHDERDQLAVNVWWALSQAPIIVEGAAVDATLSQFALRELVLTGIGTVSDAPQFALLSIDVSGRAVLDVEGHRVADGQPIVGAYPVEILRGVSARWDKTNKEIKDIGVGILTFQIEEIGGS